MSSVFSIMASRRSSCTRRESLRASVSVNWEVMFWAEVLEFSTLPISPERRMNSSKRTR